MLHSQGAGLLVIPRIGKSTIGGRAFSYHGLVVTLKPALMAVLAPASVTLLLCYYAAIALFCQGFLIACRHLCLSCSA